MASPAVLPIRSSGRWWRSSFRHCTDHRQSSGRLGARARCACRRHQGGNRSGAASAYRSRSAFEALPAPRKRKPRKRPKRFSPKRGPRRHVSVSKRAMNWRVCSSAAGGRRKRRSNARKKRRSPTSATTRPRSRSARRRVTSARRWTAPRPRASSTAPSPNCPPASRAAARFLPAHPTLRHGPRKRAIQPGRVERLPEGIERPLSDFGPEQAAPGWPASAGHDIGFGSIAPGGAGAAWWKPI